MNIAGRGNDIFFALVPQSGDMLQHLQKAGTAMAAVRGKIGATKKGLQIWREENAHRPAAATGCSLHKHHVNLVHIWSFLAIHFDADKMSIEIFGHAFVLKTFALHDMTPMAGGI